jgi:hypothetical protein
MRKGLWQRVVSTLALLAVIAATLGPIIPRAEAAVPCAMMMTASPTDGDGSSQGAMPICGSDLSCIVAAALPTPFVPTVTDLVWAPVRYWAAVDAHVVGLSVPPDVSPPISHA